MVAYAQNELTSATEMSKQFGRYLSSVSSGVVEKLAILKNNKIEAVLLPASVYESLMMLLEDKENEAILDTIETRLQTPREAYRNGRDVLEALDLSVDE